MVKAIFFDIDGTLVSFKTHKIPASTQEALKALRDKSNPLAELSQCILDSSNGSIINVI